MKKRILGLIALVLCLMLTGMPAALADFYVPHGGDGTATYIDNDGYLIEGGTLLKAYASGAICTLHYGSPLPSPSDWTVTIPPFTPIVISSRNPFWHAWLSEYSNLHVESAGTLVMRYPYSKYENAHVFVFDHPLSGVSPEYSGIIYPAENAVNAFENWVAENAPGAAMKMYDAAVYEKLTEGVWAPYSDLPGSEDVYLPGVNGKVVAVLHWANNEYLDMPDFEETPNGVLLKHLEECSPFAIVYNPNTVPLTPDAPPHSGDNSPLVLWCALAVISLAGALLIFRRRRSA